MSKTVPKNVQDAIQKYLETETGSAGEAARKAPLQVVTDALTGQSVHLLDIVVELEVPLSDPKSPNLRRHAVGLLADALATLGSGAKPSGGLNFKHVETLARFFASKFKDWQCVEGALRGVMALLVHYAPLLRGLQGDDGGGESLVVEIATQFFSDVNPASHTQQVRKAALEVLEEFLKSWSEDLKVLRFKLGEGVSGTIEEERDPRNLMLSFTIVRQLFSLKDSEKLVSDETLGALFETLMSYFPITFQPPKDDKHGITGNDLRRALNRALSATPRFAGNLVPFLLDAAKDDEEEGLEVPEADSIEDLMASNAVLSTPLQAIEMICCCLEAYGPVVARKFLKKVMSVASDQILEGLPAAAVHLRKAFCSLLGRVLAVALRDVPAGLSPHWLEKEVVKPGLQDLAADSVSVNKVQAARDGSRQLLLAAAAAHPLLKKQVWALSVAALLPPDAGEDRGLPLHAAEFLMKLLSLAAAPKAVVLSSQQLKSVMAAALNGLRSLQPGSLEEESAGESGSNFKMLANLVQLIGQLCCHLGKDESVPSPAEEAFRTLTVLLLPLPIPADGKLKEDWAAAWRSFSSSASESEAVVFEALLDAVRKVMLQSPPRVLELAPLLIDCKAADADALPQLLLTAALALTWQSGDNDETTLKLVQGISSPESFASLSKAFETAESLAGKQPSASSFVASSLAKSLGLPGSLAKLGDRAFVRALSQRLPTAEAEALRNHALKELAKEQSSAMIALLPSVLPFGKEDSWQGEEAFLKLWAAEAKGKGGAAVLEALTALLLACPKGELLELLPQLQKSGSPRCWAAAAAALLRRPGCSNEAAALLDALMADGGEVAEAFRLLLPPKLGSEPEENPTLPPLSALALQQLSRTALPKLLLLARSDEKIKQAALESAVALLSALPTTILLADCGEAVRWCTLTSVGNIKEASPAIFVAQVLQLLVRAMSHGCAWIEDELHSIVLFLTGTGAAHKVPLVRLASMQALLWFLQTAPGHLSPFRRQIERATRKGTEDRLREVRLVAVACLNAWHCAGSSGLEN